jgi:hypothetical protein
LSVELAQDGTDAIVVNFPVARKWLKSLFVVSPPEGETANCDRLAVASHRVGQFVLFGHLPIEEFMPLELDLHRLVGLFSSDVRESGAVLRLCFNLESKQYHCSIVADKAHEDGGYDHQTEEAILVGE